ncbi:MAG TPA: endonuclease III [Acidobacteriota bacterium]|nr:endonuclease III [Acidobacteriota bacterium]HQF87958.1 endonuclease III [Acidobacteriota bacterium]HQG92232.1 endonuclease III [Acidobacteriota bacterium]HQK87639.1 endonuclease III [Acidobacteriota bacterium]
MKPRDRLTRIIERLARIYPAPRCALNHRNPLELLVATILSAQCTDERVNRVTPELFRRYPDAAALATVPQAELEAVIRPTGFFRNKATSIRGCCRQLVERHGGQVPRTMEALTALPGVARKTANVVLGSAFGIAAGVVVDTHVRRLAFRLGLTNQTQPEKIERDLMELASPEHWINLAHWLILHGRTTCRARRPACAGCPLDDLCPKEGV